MRSVMFEDSSPRHVAIIMDGNGRWAAERGLMRSQKLLSMQSGLALNI